MLPVDAVVVARAESASLGQSTPETAFVIAMFGFAGAYGFDNGLLWVIVKTNKPIIGCFNACIRSGNHGAGIGKGRDYLAVVGFATV